MIVIVLIETIMSWIYFINSCILTLIENNIYGRNSRHIFNDITKYMSTDYKLLNKNLANKLNADGYH